jgi:hypothetical protein
VFVEESLGLLDGSADGGAAGGEQVREGVLG